jgi:hypothetical protein
MTLQQREELRSGLTSAGDEEILQFSTDMRVARWLVFPKPHFHAATFYGERINQRREGDGMQSWHLHAQGQGVE